MRGGMEQEFIVVFAMVFAVRFERYALRRDTTGSGSCSISALKCSQSDVVNFIPMTGPSPSSSCTNRTFTVAFRAVSSTLFLGVSAPPVSLFLFFSLIFAPIPYSPPEQAGSLNHMEIAEPSMYVSAISKFRPMPLVVCAAVALRWMIGHER